MADGAGGQPLPAPASLSKAAAACEAVLFAAARPLSLEELARAVELPPAQTAQALAELRLHLDEAGHGIQLAEVAEGFQLVTRARFFGALRRAVGSVRRPALSAAAMETLAIVAYRQPVSRAEIEALRGVNSEAALGTLLERGLIEVAHRGASPGRPVYYRTTRRFLEMFGLRSLEELPALDDWPQSRRRADRPGGGMGAGAAAKTSA